MLSTAVAALGYLRPVPVPRAGSPAMTGGLGEIQAAPKPWSSNEISTKKEMEELATKLNPAIGFWGARSSRAPTPRGECALAR